MRYRTNACRGAALLAGLLLSIGCKDELNQERTASSMLADSAIVASLTMPPAVGRIIYEPAADLSMASAMAKRPDLFKPATEAGSRRTARPTGASGTRP